MVDEHIHPCFYARVSNKDLVLKNQIKAFEDWWVRTNPHGDLVGENVVNSYSVVPVFTDKASGKDLNRPGFQKMVRQIKEGRFDTVVVYKLDRISRNARDLITFYYEMQDLGVTIISINESIDMTTIPGKIMLFMTSLFAEIERDTIIKRTKSGLERARKEGKTLGRPRKKEA